MLQETKIKLYRKIFQELKDDPVVQNLQYPDQQENFEFSCDMKDIHITYCMFNSSMDAMKLTATRHYKGLGDEQLKEIVEDLENEDGITASYFDERIQFVIFRPLGNIVESEAEKQAYETARLFFEFIKSRVLPYTVDINMNKEAIATGQEPDQALKEDYVCKELNNRESDNLSNKEVELTEPDTKTLFVPEIETEGDYEPSEEKYPEEYLEKRYPEGYPEEEFTLDNSFNDNNGIISDYNEERNNEKMEAVKESYSYVREVAEQRRQMLDEMNKAFEERKAILDYKEETLNKKERILDSRKKELDERENDVNEKVEQWDIRESEYNAKVMKLNLREQTLESKIKGLDEREEFLNSLEREKSPEEVNVLKDRIRELESKTSGPSVEEYEKMKSSSAEQIEKMKAKLNNMAISLRNSEEDITKLETDCASLKKENERLLSQKDALEKQSFSEKMELKMKLEELENAATKETKVEETLDLLTQNGYEASINEDGKIVGTINGCSFMISNDPKIILIEKPVRRGVKYKEFAKECNQSLECSCFVYERKIVYKQLYMELIETMKNVLTKFENIK